MIWIIGAGHMAQAYAKVLLHMEVEFQVIGRGEESAKIFSQETGKSVVTGGLTGTLKKAAAPPEFAIICTPVETLAACSSELISAGVKKILVEKPGALSLEELNQLIELSTQNSTKLLIGYNRRFYQSVLAAEKIINQDGGLTGLHFEITEWSHIIEKEVVATEVKQNWVISNTSHVIDLAFYLAGEPTDISTYSSGSLDWHSSSSRFTGAGKTDGNVLFSYCGFWDGPGRWSLEFVTESHRLIFRPMEKLQIQAIGSVAITDLENIDYYLDEDFKPGVFLQTKAFLNGDLSKFCTLEEQVRAFTIYKKLANY
jgi:predicted dehydrogenase